MYKYRLIDNPLFAIACIFIFVMIGMTTVNSIKGIPMVKITDLDTGKIYNVRDDVFNEDSQAYRFEQDGKKYKITHYTLERYRQKKGE